MQSRKQNHRGYAVVTGASSGIGSEFAKALAKEGYPLILVARRGERLRQLASLIHEAIHPTLECLVYEADLAKEAECVGLVRFLQKKRIAIFINNAGLGDVGYFPERNLDKELGMIDVNIRAVHIFTKQMVRQMEKQNYGFILNVASSAGLLPAGPYMSCYYATKAYVTSLTRGIARELKEHHSPVYIGCLCPGPVDTEFHTVAEAAQGLPGISAERCVREAIRQMKRRKEVIIPSLEMRLAMTFGRILPQSFYIQITAHQQKKKI